MHDPPTAQADVSRQGHAEPETQANTRETGAACRPTAVCELFVPSSQGNVLERGASSVYGRNFSSLLS